MKKDLMEWSREVINSLMRKKNDSAYLYNIKITLDPNPLNYDGMDEVLIEIIEINQFTKVESIYYSSAKEYCFNLAEAMEKINSLVKEKQNV